LKKLKINTVQFKQTVQEEQRTEEQVNIDRQYQLDAAIVRIMKSRRTITHSQLVTELFEVIGKKFVVGTHEVKKRVESLIDREYIERNTKDKDLYTYVA
jgi:cullin-4